jgi:hypothetical protein
MSLKPRVYVAEVPVSLRRELALYIKARLERCRSSVELLCGSETPGWFDAHAWDVMRLMWERDFWREKALGRK